MEDHERKLGSNKKTYYVHKTPISEGWVKHCGHLLNTCDKENDTLFKEESDLIYKCKTESGFYFGTCEIQACIRITKQPEGLKMGGNF